MRREGAIIVDPADIATAGETDDSEFEVLLYEFKADLNAYLASLGARTRYRTLADLILFNQKNRDSEMPYFGQEIFEKAEAKGPLSDKAYVDALAKDLRLSRIEGIDKTMDEHRLDCLVAPTSAPRVADRPRQRLLRGGRELLASGDRGLPRHHRARGFALRPAGRPLVLRPRGQRADVAQDRLCVRAGDEGAARAAVPGDRGPGATRRHQGGPGRRGGVLIPAPSRRISRGTTPGSRPPAGEGHRRCCAR